MTGVIHQMLLGALVLACFLAAVLFLKFWRLSKDRFFVWFALAFAIFGVGYINRSLVDDVREQTLVAYLPRLLGFLMILFAIIDKNRHPD